MSESRIVFLMITKKLLQNILSSSAERDHEAHLFILGCYWKMQPAGYVMKGRHATAVYPLKMSWS